MNITRESTGDLTATIRMEISPDDYMEAVTRNLKDYQRKANVPGFRPGKVPFGLVRKMYGKAVMADEVNRILSEQLSGYLTDEKLDLLGNPLPNKELTKPARFEEDEVLEFFFDIGMAPDFTLDLGPELEVENYHIIVEDEMVDKYIEDVRIRNGVYTHPETAGENDMASGEITELNTEGLPAAEASPHQVFISPGKVKESGKKEVLMSMKQGEKVIMKPAEWFGTPEDAAGILSLPVEKFSSPDHSYSFLVKEITHMEPSVLDAGLFEKVYPGEAIETESGFRERVRKDLSSSFFAETDKKLFNDITRFLVENTGINLPDRFLKRWLLEQEDNRMTEGEIDKNYESFARPMRWQLIENKIIREHDIHVKDEEIREYIKTYLLRQVTREFADPEMEKKYNSIVDALMQNKEQVQKINDQLFNAKMLQLLREKVTLKPVEVTYREFISIVSEDHGHDHDHEHDQEHDHDS